MFFYISSFPFNPIGWFSNDEQLKQKAKDSEDGDEHFYKFFISLAGALRKH